MVLPRSHPGDGEVMQARRERRSHLIGAQPVEYHNQKLQPGSRPTHWRRGGREAAGTK
jgi:hypothetical protein